MTCKIIDNILGENGLFSKGIENYESRQQQIDLSCIIHECLEKSQSLIAEAPCGTGKSYAYLIPAIINSIKTNNKVLIATANIALQEQLMNKDLPNIQRILGDEYPFKFALAKGRSNFVCKSAIDEAERVSLWSKVNKTYKNQVLEIIEWSRGTSTGDKSELTFIPNASVWNEMSVGDDDCKKKFCPYYSKCFANNAKASYCEANVIVCNYHLMFLDLYIKDLTTIFGTLPHYDTIICDEAHNIETIARDCFSNEIRPKSVNRILSGLDKIKTSTVIQSPYLKKETKRVMKTLLKNMNDFFDDIIIYYKSVENGYVRTIEKGIVEYKKICASLMEASDILKEYGNKLVAIGNHDAQLFLSRSKEAIKLANNIEMHVSQSDENFAYWITYKEKENSGVELILNSKPIYVQDLLKNIVWSKMKSVVVLSATMTVASHENQFSFMINSLGLNHDINKFICSSPFNFNEQCALIVPQSIKMPLWDNDKEYRESFLKAVQRAIMISNGRAMILFTSYAHLNYFYENCTEIKSKYKILSQGSGEYNRSKMIEIFKEDEHSVLLGTNSFWEGIDVPGNALSLLVIDKIPFPNVKADPVLDAMQERNSNFFNDEYLPRAILMLKQGSGRLIRTRTDKGCIIIGDNRILPGVKNYSHKFLSSLPSMPFSNNIENIELVFKS